MTIVTSDLNQNWLGMFSRFVIIRSAYGKRSNDLNNPLPTGRAEEKSACWEIQATWVQRVQNLVIWLGFRCDEILIFLTDCRVIRSTWIAAVVQRKFSSDCMKLDRVETKTIDTHWVFNYTTRSNDRQSRANARRSSSNNSNNNLTSIHV